MVRKEGTVDMPATATPPLVVPVTLFPEYEQLLADYRRALERLDGKEATDRLDDETLLRIAAACYMRSVVMDAKAGVA